LTPDEADMIMRQLKKGTVGLIVLNQLEMEILSRSG